VLLPLLLVSGQLLHSRRKSRTQGRLEHFRRGAELRSRLRRGEISLLEDLQVSRVDVQLGLNE
jgi:hypothetical protein